MFSALSCFESRLSWSEFGLRDEMNSRCSHFGRLFSTCRNGTTRLLIRPLPLLGGQRSDWNWNSGKESSTSRTAVWCGLAAALGAAATASQLKKIHAATEPVVSTTNSLRDRFSFIADVVEKAAPSVVSIEVNDSIDRRHSHYDNPFSIPFEIVTQHGGSGFVVRDDGLIVTNAHLFMTTAAPEIQVRLADGRNFDAVLIAVDKSVDIAVVKIRHPEKLPPALRLADSEKVRTGEFVFAIGSPFLVLKNSVSFGVVSNANQTFEVDGRDQSISYVQTDAAINIGNSGGPLLNLDGEVVAVNAMKVADGTNIGFGIPSKYVVDFLRNIRDEEERPSPKAPSQQSRKSWFGFLQRHKKGGDDVAADGRPNLGIAYYVYSANLFGQTVDGLLVASVTLYSPAHRAGIYPGDVILEINGHEAIDSRTFQAEIEKSTKVGTARLKVLRNGELLSFEVNFECR